MSGGIDLAPPFGSEVSESDCRRSPLTQHSLDGLYPCGTPLTFAACRAVTIGTAEDCSLTDPRKFATKCVGAAIKAGLADSDGNNAHLLTCVDEVLAQCGVRQAFERALRVQ